MNATLAVIEQFERRYGIPVSLVLDANVCGQRVDAMAIGVVRRRIVVGEGFCFLSSGEQMAILIHEAAHVFLWHRLRRILLVPVFWTKFAARAAIKHELEADDFVVLEDHGPFLAAYLARNDALRKMRGIPEGEYHPPASSRIANIRDQLREKFHVAHAA